MQRPEVRAYLGLERAMAALEVSEHETLADQVRDLMDPIWSLLTSEERDSLNARQPNEMPGYG